MTAADTDVVIVGYGPVGQVLAGLLGRQGHRVVVFERHPSLYPTPRAGHFDHEIMRIFQTLGIAAAVERTSAPARTYDFLDQGGHKLSSLPRDWPAPSGWDASYHFYQPELEKVLDDHVRTYPLVSVRRGCEVTVVTGLADQPVVEIEDVTTGAKSRLSASFVVGADGANSVVRTSQSIGRQDLGFSADWLVVDVRIHDGRPMPDIPDTGQVCNPARPSHMARLGGSYLRWEFMLVDGDNSTTMTDESVVWALLAPWLSPLDGEIVRRVVYQFQSKIADDFRRGPVFLAGDAAHLMPPFLGQGMCSGIRDAATLAWQLDLVLRGAAPAGLLDDYSRARRPHVEAYVRESVRVGEIVCETDPEKAAQNLAAMTRVATVPPPFQPPIGGGFRAGDALAGQLSVQPRIRGGDGSRMRLDDVLGPGFHLLSTHALDATAATLATELREQIGLRHAVIDSRRVGRPRASELEADGEPQLEEDGTAFATWMADAGVSAVIVRPDFYVYGSCGLPAATGGLLTSLRADLRLT